MFIEDGQGKGNIAAVNNDNQLITRAASVEQRLVSALDDNYYEATTGKVTLADADETGIIYVKNTGTTDIVVDRVFYDIWEPF